MRKNIDPHASLPAFEQSLIDDNLAPNTVRAYVKAVRDFLARFPALNKENLLRHRSALMEHYSPKTVNQRVMAINRWLLALRRPQWRLKGVRLGRRSFVENVGLMVKCTPERGQKCSLFHLMVKCTPIIVELPSAYRGCKLLICFQ